MKIVSAPPEWKDDGSDWKRARVALLVPSLGVDGLYLRIKAPRAENGAGFLFQVEYQPGAQRDTEPLERLEWRMGHANPDLGPREVRFLECHSTHLHSFELNFVSKENRMRAGNLPLAEPVDPDPATFEDFLAFAKKSLKINGLETIARPKFQGELLS